MTSLIAAGGPAQVGADDSPLAASHRVTVKYQPADTAGDVYSVVLSPVRLTAIVERTEEGFVAESPELGSLGYGGTPDAAVADLRDAVLDYLTVLAEKRPPLAPSVAHHALYLELLNAPQGSWFAAITGATSSTADAA